MNPLVNKLKDLLVTAEIPDNFRVAVMEQEQGFRLLFQEEQLPLTVDRATFVHTAIQGFPGIVQLLEDYAIDRENKLSLLAAAKEKEEIAAHYNRVISEKLNTTINGLYTVIFASFDQDIVAYAKRILEAIQDGPVH